VKGAAGQGTAVAGATRQAVTSAGRPTRTQCHQPHPVGASGSKQVIAKLRV